MNRSVVVFLFLSAALLQAQSPQATISGVVRDPQGASITQAEVTAINAGTGVKSTARTNDSGFYSLLSLPIGAYTFTIEHSGFRRYVRENVLLTTGQSLGMDVMLEIGTATESVTVSASVSTLETRTSDMSQLVESKTVEDIPLGDRRTMNIVNITGAAVFVNYDSGSKPNFSLAGGRTQSQNFFIDGGTAQNMRLGIGQIDTDPPVETVQEVKVLANNYSAEYGGSAGGVIIATTKSGTNRLHGSLYEYLRNDKLDAANFFAPVVGNEKVRAPLRYNVFGGTIGGPVLFPKLYNGKDKTFFFFSYEGSRRRDGLTDTFTVPTELQRGGDFSQTFAANGTLIPIYDPSTTRTEAGRTIRDQFAGNRIPASRLDPVGLKLVDFYPLPNRGPDNASGANNYRTNYVQGLTRNNFLAKVDHNFGNSDKFSARYLYNSDDLAYTSAVPIAAADTRANAERHQNFYYAAWTRIFSPALINEFRFTYGNRINHELAPGVGGAWPGKIGLRGVVDDAFPQFTVAGFRNLGPATQERKQYPIQQFQYVNNLSWIQGRHSFKFGAEVRPSYNYEINRPTVSGSFTFSPLGTGLPGATNSGNALASLLTGFPLNFASRETQILDRSSWYLAGFAQDDWSIHRDLTLNIGVRWETDTPIVDRNNRMNGFDATRINPVSGTPGVVRFMGVNGFRTTPYDTDLNNFGPRLGLAWKPFGSKNTVIRTGFGIFYAHPFDAGGPTAASLGFEVSSNLNSPDNGITAPFLLREGVPVNAAAPVLDDSYGAVPLGRNPATQVSFFEENRRIGYSQQFNFSIQREIASGVLVEAGYIGNLSRKLSSSNLSLNQVTPDKLTANSTQRDRPFPQFSNVLVQFPSLGVSNYHAALVRFEKRFAQGFNILSTYTFSKFLDNTNEGGGTIGMEGGAYSDYYNRRADYGPSENDVRHRFTYSSIYELPAGRGRRFLSDNPLRYVLGDWSVGAVVTLQSGAPFTVTTQVNSVFSAAGSLRADVLRSPNLPNGERTLGRWFDVGAFTQPAPARFGNQGVGILRADGIVNADVSLLRNFVFGEQRKFQLRGEFFNLTNHPNFGIPGRVYGAPGFGVVSSAGAARRVQIGLRLVY